MNANRRPTRPERLLLAGVGLLLLAWVVAGVQPPLLRARPAGTVAERIR